MLRLDEVRNRIGAKVPVLAGRLGTAADFALLVEKNRMPQQSPAGFVLPGELRGGRADVVTGLFRQAYTETVIVVLVVRVAGDPLGDRALDEITPLVRDVVQAVAGWTAGSVNGTFVLGQAELVGAKDGALVFQIDFHLDDQLRIATHD